MNKSFRPSDDSLSPTLARQIDRICDRFEAACKAGQRPRIEDYLGEIPEPERLDLFRELLVLELSYRVPGGEQPTLEEYRARFPAAGELIAAAYDRMGPATEPDALHAQPVDLARAGGDEEQDQPTVADGSPSARSGNGETLFRNGDEQTQTAVEVSSPSPDAPVIPGYEILGELGRGGMGVVYQARQNQLNRTVALKMILAGAHAAPEAAVRFLAEAEAIARLRHPNIVQIHGIGSHEGRPYFDLEYVEGGSLADRLKGIPWPPRQAAETVEQLGHAIAEAHRLGIVHRDLKPANVLLTADGTPKIADFGLAKALNVESGLTRTDVVMGSPSYMAPEQAEGRTREAGAAADIYSLGAIFYELLTGRPPFRGATQLETLEQVRTADPVPPSRLVPGLPRDAETITLKCLQKEPSRRYAGAEELAEDLRRFLADEPIRARPEGHVERLRRWRRRNRVVANLAALVALLLVMITAGALAAAWRFKRDGETMRSTLRDSYLSQARAHRWSGRPGRRFAGLDAVAKATAIRPGPDLRDEAIAGMALTDLDLLTTWEAALPYPMAGAFDVAFERYAVTDEGGNISIRVVADHREVRRLPGPGYSSLVPRFSPDGRYLAAKYHPGGRDHPYRFIVWHIERGNIVLDLTCEGSPGEFSPDSSRIAVSRVDGSIVIHDLDTGREIMRLGRGPMPAFMAWHPAGSKLAVSYDAIADIRVYDVNTGSLFLHLPHQDHPPPGGALAWSPDGMRLAETCQHGQIFIWNAVDLGPPMTLSGHSGKAVAIAFNHRGDLLATTSWDKTVRLWDASTGKQLVSVPGSYGVQFSPDDQQLGFSVEGTGLRLCRVAGNRELRTIPMVQDTWRVDFSPDGRFVVAPSSDGMRIFDVATAKRIAYREVQGLVSALFQPDGRSLITSGASGLQRWPITLDGAAGPLGLRVQPPQTYELPRFHAPTNINLAADGRTLAVSNRPNGQAVVFDLQTEKVLFRGDQPWVNAIAISPDGRWLASSPWGGSPIEIRAWDLQTGKLAWTLPGTQGHLEFSPDNRWLIIGAGGEYQVREVGTWRLNRRIRRDSSELHGAVAFTRDGSTMAIVPAIGQIRLINLNTSQVLAILTSPESTSSEPQRILGLAFSLDSTHLAAACSTPRAVQLWDLRLIRQQLAAMGLDWELPPYPSLEDDQPRSIAVADLAKSRRIVADGGEKALIRSHEGPVRSIAFSPEGQRIITGGDDRTVRVSQIVTGRCDLSIGGLSGGARGAVFLPDGNRVVTSSDDFVVRVHDASTGKVVRTLNPTTRERGVARVALRHDGRHLAAKDGNRSITIWDLEKGERVRSLSGIDSAVYGMAYSRDGRLLASAGSDRVIRVWDCESGHELRTLRGHLDTVDLVAFSPDGRLIVSASWDQTLRLWEVATGRPLATLGGHANGVWGVAFSPDGKRLASVGPDGTVRIWRAADVWSLEQTHNAKSPTSSVAFSPDGKQVAASCLDGTVPASTGRDCHSRERGSIGSEPRVRPAALSSNRSAG